MNVGDKLTDYNDANVKNTSNFQKSPELKDFFKNCSIVRIFLPMTNCFSLETFFSGISLHIPCVVLILLLCFFFFFFKHTISAWKFYDYIIQLSSPTFRAVQKDEIYVHRLFLFSFFQTQNFLQQQKTVFESDVKET